MDGILIKEKRFLNAKTISLDVVFITAIYFIPTFSHLLSLPLYFIEPMRIILVLALAHTNRTNAYLLAFTLPLFSFLFSGHPVFPKVAIVMAELILNVFLYFTLYDIFKRYYSGTRFELGLPTFFAMIVSILFSKVMYYFLKYILISYLVLNSEMISTPVYLQFSVALILSIYFVFITTRRKIEN